MSLNATIYLQSQFHCLQTHNKAVNPQKGMGIMFGDDVHCVLRPMYILPTLDVTAVYFLFFFPFSSTKKYLK